jgi:hypothetical protein
MSTLIDPDFKYHQVTTRAWTQLALHMADSIVVPFNVTNLASRLSYYTRSFKKKYDRKMNPNGATMGKYYNYFSQWTLSRSTTPDKDLKPCTRVYKRQTNTNQRQRHIPDSSSSLRSPPPPSSLCRHAPVLERIERVLYDYLLWFTPNDINNGFCFACFAYRIRSICHRQLH